LDVLTVSRLCLLRHGSATRRAVCHNQQEELAVRNAIACCGFALALVCSQQHATGGVVLTLSEVGSDVVASGSGTLNLAALNFDHEGGAFSLIGANAASIIVGPTFGESAAGYGGISGPNNFGPGFVSLKATSGFGDLFGLLGQGGTPLLTVPEGYISGSSLFGRATWTGKSFASLEVTPGKYVWTWGTGPTADSFTLQIGETATAIPEPATWGLFALIGLVVLCRRVQIVLYRR